MRTFSALALFLSMTYAASYIRSAGAEKKTLTTPQNTPAAQKKKLVRTAGKPSKRPPPAASQRLSKRPNVRRSINQLSSADLDKSIDSFEQLLDTLPEVCRLNSSLLKRAESFQTKLIEAKKKLRQIKDDFVIRDPSLFSYINTLDFYLNQPQDFNYERNIPENTEELKEYISGLSFSFQMMYRTAFNVPENTPANKLPEGWGRSIGAALTCLQNNQ